MAHPHHDDHGHGDHDHGRGADRRALAIVFALTSAFVVAEVIGGLVTGSLAL
ncbi:MAG: cation transporter, partial [Rubrobacter sp.]|nr:cation transporter [Rubrobacter sp.]